MPRCGDMRRCTTTTSASFTTFFPGGRRSSGAAARKPTRAVRGVLPRMQQDPTGFPDPAGQGPFGPCDERARRLVLGEE